MRFKFYFIYISVHVFQFRWNHLRQCCSVSWNILITTRKFPPNNLFFYCKATFSIIFEIIEQLNYCMVNSFLRRCFIKLNKKWLYKVSLDDFMYTFQSWLVERKCFRDDISYSCKLNFSPAEKTWYVWQTVIICSKNLISSTETWYLP